MLKNKKLTPRFLEKLKRQTLIQSTASSLRLSGRRISNKRVEKIIKEMNKK